MTDKNNKSVRDTERLLPEKRYGISILEILKNQEVYVLEKEEGAYAVSELEGKKMISMWPGEIYAANNISFNWADFHTKRIALLDLEPILDFIEDQKWNIDMFPVGGKTGEIVTVEELITDLNNASQLK